VKSALFLLCLPGLFLGCATMIPHDRPVSMIPTLQTDMYPESITRAEYYEQMALGYSQEKQYEKAVEYFKLSLLHNPSSVNSYVELADVYVSMDRHLLALLSLQSAEKLEPDNLTVMKKLGDLYLQAGLYTKSREVYEHLLKISNHEEEAKWALFYIYKLEKKNSDAMAQLARVTVTDKNAGKVAYEKALLYKAGRELDLYRETLKEAVRLDPRDRDILIEFAKQSYETKTYKEAAVALLNYSNTHSFDKEISQHLAFSSVQAGFYPVAIREYEKQKLNGDPDELNLKIAHCYFLMDSLPEAEKLYLKLALDSQSAEARFYLGQIYITKNDMQNAAFVLEQIPASSEFFADAQSKLALYYKTQGQDDKALNTLREAYALRPDQLEVYQSYGDFLIENKRYVEAVALIERGIQLFPKDEELRLKMAYIHFRLNNQKSFKKQIMAALRINPQSADAYSMLSELWYMKDRDIDETLFFVNKAMYLNSKNKNVKPILAWVLMQKNHSTEAVAIFEEFYEQNPGESFFARSLSQVYRRGGVKNKAEKLSELAAKLESDDSLKSRFIFKDKTEKADVDLLRETKTRLPASLENQ
jgi:Tfp pilus assembly protein PilF